MTKEWTIHNKIIQIHYQQSHDKNLPVIILNTYGNEGRDVFHQCCLLHSQPFILVSISHLDWNNDLTPWYAEGLNHQDNHFLGHANDYIEELTHIIIPQACDYIKNELHHNILDYTIAGYSLAGLFAIYTAYKTDIFSKVVSASGSVWFPQFIDFVKQNTISSHIQKMYFSLGNKENKTINPLLASVKDKTIELEHIYHQQGIQTVYHENDGNHFHDATLRMAQGIYWILK